VRAALDAFPGKRLKALVGDIHLVDAPPEEIARMAGGIASMDPGAVLHHGDKMVSKSGRLGLPVLDVNGIIISRYYPTANENALC
jgi:hypothetical protein